MHFNRSIFSLCSLTRKITEKKLKQKTTERSEVHESSATAEVGLRWERFVKNAVHGHRHHHNISYTAWTSNECAGSEKKRRYKNSCTTRGNGSRHNLKLQPFVHIHRMCDVKLSDKVTCKELRDRLGLEDVVAVLQYDSGTKYTKENVEGCSCGIFLFAAGCISGRLAQCFGGFSTHRIFFRRIFGGTLFGKYSADFWRILDKSHDIYSQAAGLLAWPTWQLQPKLTIAVASCDIALCISSQWRSVSLWYWLHVMWVINHSVTSEPVVRDTDSC